MSDIHREGPGRSADAHLLIVDDESHVRGLIGRWLTDAGYACVEARDPDEAWELLRRYDIHLVTLDIRMPSGSGLSIVHEVKKQFPDTVLVMLTAVDQTQPAVTALRHGAYAYLVKPVDRETLLFHVRSGLEQRNKQIEKQNYLRQLEERVREHDRTRLHQPHDATFARQTLVAAAPRCAGEERWGT
jgi:DNA-binding NtrC family response regulator